MPVINTNPDAEEPSAAPTLVERIYSYVATIPPGRVLPYGEVGQALGTTGRRVGAALATCDDSTCWHRVVGHDGYLRIAARSPELFFKQKMRLADEGVPVEENGKVPLTFFWDGE